MKKVNKVATTEAVEVKGSKLVIEDVVAEAETADAKKCLSELVGEQMVKVTVADDDYDTLSYLTGKYWTVARVKLIGGNQVQLTIAYGKTLRQGAIVIPKELDLSETIYIETDKGLFIEE